MRVDFDPESTDPGAFHQLLTAVVVSRPIAWASTQAAGDGETVDLAPAWS